MTQIKIAENIQDIMKKIALAVEHGGRKADECTLVAVSKTRTGAEILAAIDAGQKCFGENRVQEASDKWPAIRAQFPEVQLRLIGALQSNKVKPALKLFDVIETLDRPSLAKALAREDIAANYPKLKIYIQVNTGEEPQKGGVLPRELSDFVKYSRDELSLPVVGLMCIPPVDEEAALHFALLKNLARSNELTQLSMGMSGDYEIAAEIGATSVRVGTAIFGPRLSQ